MANVPYAVWGMGGTGITLADQADVYAMVVSHEIAELIVDPRGDLSNPEVCDPCCINCEGAAFFRAYFDSFNDYLGTNQSTPPGGFNFAYYVAVVVKPEGAATSEGDCHASNGDCNYPPVIQNFYFVIEKDDYGRDEVSDTLTTLWPSICSWKGFRPNAVGSSVPGFTGSFNNISIPGLSITHTIRPTTLATLETAEISHSEFVSPTRCSLPAPRSCPFPIPGTPRTPSR